MAKRLTNLRVSEISLVDRPANPGARVVLAKRAGDEIEYWKREFTQEQRDAAAKDGAALPDGSFPIKNKSDLHNAMQAIGRAKDPGKAKAHIKARAKTLGLTDELSDAFKSLGFFAKVAAYFTKSASDAPDANGDDTGLTDDGDFDDDDDDQPAQSQARKDAGSVAALFTAYDEILSDPSKVDKSAALAISRNQFLAHMAQDIGKGADMTIDLRKAFGLKPDATDDDVQKAFEAVIAKAAATDTALTVTKRELAVAKMSAKHSAFMNHDSATMPKGGKDAFADMTSDERDAHMDKHPISKSAGDVAIEKAAERVAAAEARVAKLESAAEIAAIAKRIGEEWGGTAEHAADLHAIAKADPDRAKRLETTLKAAAAQVKTGKLFAEIGSKQQGEGTAKGAIDARSAELRKNDPKMEGWGEDRVMAKIAESRDPKDQALWKAYRAEQDKLAA